MVLAVVKGIESTAVVLTYGGARLQLISDCGWLVDSTTSQLHLIWWLRPVATSQMVSAALLAVSSASPWPVDDGRRAFRHTQQCKLPFTAGRPSAAGRARARSRSSIRLPVSLRDHSGGGPRVANAFSTLTDIRRHSGVFEVHGNAISQ